MGIYWILVAGIFLISIPIQPCRSKTKNAIYLWIVFILLFAISGFRAFSVGADTQTYANLFHRIQYISNDDSRYESGFLTYIRVLNRITDNPGILLIASSMICIGAVCYFAYKLSENAPLSILLYILMGSYFSQMNVMRQALALSITEIAFLILILKGNHFREKVISAGLIVLATTFHSGAGIAFIPYILLITSTLRMCFFSTAKKMLKVTIIVAVGSFIGYSLIMALASSIAPAYAGYFSGTWSDSNYNAALFNTLIPLTFAIAGATILGDELLNRKQQFAAIMISFSIVFNTLSMRMEIWNRMAGMFNIYTYLLWTPEFVCRIKKAKSRGVILILIVTFSALYMWMVLTFRPEWSRAVPYAIR